MNIRLDSAADTVQFSFSIADSYVYLTRLSKGLFKSEALKAASLYERKILHEYSWFLMNFKVNVLHVHLSISHIIYSSLISTL